MSSDSVEVSNPFICSETIAENFHKAEKIFQHAILQIHNIRKFGFAPRVVIHQQSVSNEKNLRELALGAGAREVLIYQEKKWDTHGLDK
ncbi:MAG: hypothetical protein RPR97_15900 [Colwellia sp.]